MIGAILGERLRQYRPANTLEQENALAELLQHFVLASLSRARFFSDACFQGGTCLRILHGMSRFSEDLDFVLRTPDPRFDWSPYLDRIRNDFDDEDLQVEIGSAAGDRTAVRRAQLRTLAVDRIPGLTLPFPRDARKRIRIRLEVDTNPPAGSVWETRYLSFPLTTAIATQDLNSGFATKVHALLCRDYVKGRDWYDFLWYVSRKVVPRYGLLASALDQQGPWAGEGVVVTLEWLVETMHDRIEGVDWDDARKDVSRFVVSSEQESVALWSTDFFSYHLDRFAEYAESSRR